MRLKKVEREGATHIFNGDELVFEKDVAGTKHWFKDDKLHRDNDKPAMEYADGTKHWLKDGKYHRDNDNPAIEYADGTKRWFKDGTEYSLKSKEKEIEFDVEDLDSYLDTL